MRVIIHWSRLPQKVVDVPSLEMQSRIQPDLVESVPAYCRGVELSDLGRLFPTQIFYSSIIHSFLLCYRTS